MCSIGFSRLWLAQNGHLEPGDADDAMCALSAAKDVVAAGITALQAQAECGRPQMLCLSLTCDGPTADAGLAQLYAAMVEPSILVAVAEGDFDSARKLDEQRVRSRFRESAGRWNWADDRELESVAQHAVSGLTLLRAK